MEGAVAGTLGPANTRAQGLLLRPGLAVVPCQVKPPPEVGIGQKSSPREAAERSTIHPSLGVLVTFASYTFSLPFLMTPSDSGLCMFPCNAALDSCTHRTATYTICLAGWVRVDGHHHVTH